MKNTHFITSVTFGLTHRLQRREVPDFSSSLLHPEQETKDQSFCCKTSTTRALQRKSASCVFTKAVDKLVNNYYLKLKTHFNFLGTKNITWSSELEMNLLKSPIETTSFFFISSSLVSVLGKTSPNGPSKLEPDGIIRQVTTRLIISSTETSNELIAGCELCDGLKD